jgi:hypothetical protein
MPLSKRTSTVLKAGAILIDRKGASRSWFRTVILWLDQRIGRRTQGVDAVTYFRVNKCSGQTPYVPTSALSRTFGGRVHYNNPRASVVPFLCSRNRTVASQRGNNARQGGIADVHKFTPM